MVKHLMFFLAAFHALTLAAVATPGTVYLTGNTVFPPSPTGGTINVVIDLLPGHTFENGAINFGVQLSNLDVVKFTSAEVLNSDGRWTAVSDMATPGLVSLSAASVLSPGLPAGAQDVIFATIDFEFVSQELGAVDIIFVTNSESMFDPAVDPRDYITSQYTFIPNFVRVIPEPSTVAMIGMGLLGLVFRRRNGSPSLF
jgi:hypothetical protein